MKDFIKKNEIWIFLVLAPITHTLFVLIRREGYIQGFVYTHGRFFLLLFLLIGIVLYTRGSQGVKDMFRPMLQWKINPFWYLFSLLFALTIAVLTLVIKTYYNDIELLSVLQLDFAATSLWGSFIILIWAFMGEVVWVSYCLRELAKTVNPFFAILIVGLVWTLWWIPAVYLDEGVIPDFPVWPLLLGMTGAAGMCAVVYSETKSGICVWILQFMMNMSLILLPVSPKIGGIFTYKIYAVLYFTVMLLFVYSTRTIQKLKVIPLAK